MSAVSPPQLITPPSGLCDVFAFNAATNTVELLGSFEDATRAHSVMRKRGGGSACLARGGVVCSFLSSTPLSHHPRIKAAVALEWARRTPQPSASTADRTHAIAPTGAAVEPSTTPTNTDVEPSAPSTTPTDEEPMTTEADLCGRCKKHPAAGITPTTPKGTEEWCAHCRRIESARRNGNRVGGDRVSQSAKTAKKPTRKPAPRSATVEASQSADPMAPLRAALDRLVARGGVDEDRVRAIVREELLALLVRPS